MSNGQPAYSTSREPVVSLTGVHRIYHLAGEDIHAVNDVTLDVWPGQMTAIVGRSGSGKTTLLNRSPAGRADARQFAHPGTRPGADERGRAACG